MAKKPSDTTVLEDMFEHALKDMYYAEKKIHTSLPKVIKAAQSSELKTDWTHMPRKCRRHGCQIVRHGWSHSIVM